VGNGGVAMSGGQKQRIAIARALIKKPAVLLLDEATSALDAASERVVQQSIDALQKLKAQTTIVIAHRLSTIRNVDRICVIQDGKIAEMGSHDELMQTDGLYADLVKLQMDSNDSLAIEEGLPVDEEIVESSSPQVVVVEGDEVKDLTDEERQKLKTSSLSSAVDEEVEVVITKEDRSRTVKLIWARVMDHKEYMVLSLVSAAFYGAVYPCKQ
jgi:ATP-binding cassette subfamily B (MDR/TAP) protein 1